MTTELNLEQKLADLLDTRDFHPEMLGKDGRPADAENAKTFSFDYVSGSGKNYGTMVIVLGNDNEMYIMYGDNLGKTIEDTDDRSEFFDFQQQLMDLANRNRWSGTLMDIGKLKRVQAGIAAIKEGLFEGYYGTRKISYTGKPTEARLMIKHNRTLGENDARFRYVESVFIETADGERFKLPFTNMSGSRAMLEHVRQGGKPYDVRGSHICEIVTEMKVLSRFNRAAGHRVMEGVTQQIVEQAQHYYAKLRENIKHLGNSRGYKTYFESWHPLDVQEQESLVEDIKTMFIEQTLDTRIEAALPLLARIQQQGNTMKEADIFESWMNQLVEGTWSLPETPEQVAKLKELMGKELVVGPDATNATEQLYDLIGDDILFDRLSELAERDPRANAWNDTEVMNRLRELGIETDGVAPAGAEGDAAPVDPAAAASVPQQGVAEAAKWRDPKYQGKTFDYDDSYEGPQDTQAGKVSLDRAGMRQTRTFDPLEYKAREKQATGKLTPQDIKYATAKNFGQEKQQQLDYDRSRKAEQGVAEGEGRFAGDTPVNVGGATMKMIQVGDIVKYLGQKAEVDALSKDRKRARITIERGMGGVTQDVNTSDLKQLGQGVAEGLELNAMRKAAGLPVVEGRMLDESGETLSHIMDRFKHEVDEFEKGGDLDNDLYYALFDYYSDHGEIPYGVAKGRDGDPFEWVTDRLDQELGTGNHAPRVAEADVLNTFEVMSGFDAPVAEGSCNMTAEGEYCPEHALAECGMYEMGTVAGSVAPVIGESNNSDALLARIKSLALIK